MAETGKIVNITLWGATQVGKTTALAAYLCHNPARPSWLDRKAPETFDAVTRLNKVWIRLRKNEPPGGTPTTCFYDVKHKDGRTIRFRDVPGGNTLGERSGGAEEAEDALQSAVGVILFVEWPGSRLAYDRLAVDTASLYIGHCSCTLAITKIECHLTIEQASEFFADPRGAAKSLKVPPSFEKLLNKVSQDLIFPISVYGYAPDGLPAQQLNEFGQLVPIDIRPYFVAEPFDTLLEEVL